MKDFSSLQCINRKPKSGGMMDWLGLVAGCLLLASPLAQAEPGWQWLDAKGRKVYSDTPPPPTVSPSSILRRPAGMAAPIPLSVAEPPSGAPALAAPAAQATAQPSPAPATDKPSAASATLSDAQLRAEVEKRNAAIRQENCRQARATLATLNSDEMLLTVNAAGEQVPLDDKTRAAEIRRMREAEQANCLPPAKSSGNQ